MEAIMAGGKGYYVLEIAGQVWPCYGTHKGGKTMAKSREVTVHNRPATTIKVPSGALEYEDLEVEFEERLESGGQSAGMFDLDQVVAFMQDWNKTLDANGNPARKSITLKLFADAEFQVLKSTLELTEAWCCEFSLPEGDRSSDERRKMTAKFSHRSGVVVPVTGAPAATTP